MPSNRDDTTQRIGLPEAIAELRSQLARARAERKENDIVFAVNEVEVELGLEFGWTREGNAGVKIWSFLEIGGKAGASDKSTHKVKLKLTIPEGHDRTIGGESTRPAAALAAEAAKAGLAEDAPAAVRPKGST